MRASTAAPLAVLLLLSSITPARAELELRWGGRVQSDIRFRPKTVGLGDWYARQELRDGVSRNENIFKLKLEAVVDRFAAVAELDFVYYGYSRELTGIGDLSLREQVDPYRIEAQAVYVEAVDLLVKGLDLRVGQQQIFWGKGDQFNPTNTINPNDVEDPLLFGEQVANLMVKLDYAPFADWTITGVLVPIFKPALLPDSAFIGIGAADRLPMTDDALRWRLHTEKAFTQDLLGFPTVVDRAIPDLPERSLKNMQWALRVAGVIAEQDIALSYYYGRTDVPQPYLNITRLTHERRCNPADEKQCIQGTLETETHLGYPRMQVAGFNMAGQVNLLGWLSRKIQPLGYRVELGVFFPQEAGIILYQEELDFPVAPQPAGEYRYHIGSATPSFPRPAVVEDTPFAKWVVGLDYTFNEHLYANVQWVHGFPDEFGAGDFFHEGYSVRKGGTAEDMSPAFACMLQPDAQSCLAQVGNKLATEILRPRLGDYLVLGVDVHVLSQKMLLRLFTIWDLVGVYEESWDEAAQKRVREHRSMFSEKGFSAVIYPEIQYNFGGGFELHAGALLMLGQDHTKFGDPATGGHQIFTRARFSF